MDFILTIHPIRSSFLLSWVTLSGQWFFKLSSHFDIWFWNCSDSVIFFVFPFTNVSKCFPEDTYTLLKSFLSHSYRWRDMVLAIKIWFKADSVSPILSLNCLCTTVKPAHAVTCIKRSHFYCPVIEKFHMNWTSLKRSPVL